MHIKVNGQTHQVDGTDTVSAVLKYFRIDPAKGVAVALNDSVVPKQEYEKKAVHDGDAIEIIRAVQGG